MLKLRQSIVAKGVFALVLALSIMVTSICSWNALWRLDCAYGENWQDNSTFESLLRQRYNSVNNLFTTEENLAAGGLDYVTEMDSQNWAEELSVQLSAENTNYRYQILSEDGKTVIKTNLEEGEILQDVVLAVSYDTINMTYLQSVDDNASTLDVEEYTTVSYIVASGVTSDPQADDEFLAMFYNYQSKDYLMPFGVIGVAGGVAVLVCLLFLLWSAGYRRGEELPVLGWWDRLPLEIFLTIFGICFALALVGWTAIFKECWWGYWYGFGSGVNHDNIYLLGIVSTAGIALAGAILLAGILCTLATRARCGKLLRTTMCYYIVSYLWRKAVFLVNNLSILWRAAVLFLLYVALNFMARYGLASLYPVPVFLVDGLALGAILWWTYCFRRVRDGAEAIASGNLTHRVDTDKLPHDLKHHGESLNNISLGMESAVDSRIKSERFKAELITNVSHDLKTPLTSIINYVDLLKSTEQIDPKAGEYIEVLERKSQRLKKLTEDLVEASKASTGTLKVNRDKIGLDQLLDQAIGEYQEKLESKGLILVTSVAEGENHVLADGRHLWRVVDNLLGNCVKYAMEGTRVYVELTRGRGQVELSVKNISREPITVSPDQLVERFVRGDEARATDGSGLGLSIAKSLTELQGGTFQLMVDGDLFKAVISLPQAG